ncbi:MAG TPA: AAA family ATPase [Pseudobdellovibrionaceae bacterium]|nr:AAA family ATPase [Pseudobdellovibrionaceae bacterium]
MIPRIVNLSKEHSFFLFGPRGVGKSTLLESWLQKENTLFIDLLEPAEFKRYSFNPEMLAGDCTANKYDIIVIDEIQKVPALLDVIQKLMRKTSLIFILTGSSARKLRRGAANLLGGRAFEFHLHPLTHIELEKSMTGFNLDLVLAWGSLPYIQSMTDLNKVRSLHGYITTYLKEEVLIEQVVRKLEPFQRFLEVAAQMNGKILNYAKIARDSGVEEKSVARYFQILDDTLLGFHLPPYSTSIRKQQSQKSKFYFFDSGIVRALSNQVTLPLVPHTNVYGDLFEHFIINEFIRINDYLETHFKFTFFRSKDDVEIDLIIERPGQATVLVEIKAKNFHESEDSKNLQKIGLEFPSKELYVLSNCLNATVIEEVYFLHWREGMKKIFGKAYSKIQLLTI